MHVAGQEDSNVKKINSEPFKLNHYATKLHKRTFKNVEQIRQIKLKKKEFEKEHLILLVNELDAESQKAILLSFSKYQKEFNCIN